MRILAFLFIAVAVVSCKEKDLTKDNDPVEVENVYIKTSFVYDGESFYKDSAITNNQGLSFFIDEVQMVIDNFLFKQGSDTVVMQGDPFVVTNVETDQAILVMPPGGYSGNFSLRVGLDSAAQVDIAVHGARPGSEIDKFNLVRGDMNGIDNVVIKGRLIDPLDPLDSIGKINFEYRLGTAVTSRIKTSLTRHFAIEKTSTFSTILIVDLEPIFNDFDIEARPFVKTDPQDLVDYNIAILMADSLKLEIF